MFAVVGGHGRCFSCVKSVSVVPPLVGPRVKAPGYVTRARTTLPGLRQVCTHLSEKPQRNRSEHLVVRADAQSSAMPAPSEGGGKRGWTLISGIVALLLVVGILAVVSSGNTSSVKDFLVNGPLGRSGFLAAFSLIFLSEIGDKTFFIAALLAMRLGRWISFVGSLGALAVMTVISVCIGAVFSRVPDAFKSSIPIGEVAGILLLVFFGLKALRDASRVGPSDKDDEQDEAERAVKEAERAREGGRISPLVSLVEVGTLIFLAEWGDRSMLATIALGAAQNPVGVAVGAIVGHAVATAIAVVGGAIAAKYVSEKTINIASGVLFLIFAAVTAWGMF